MKRYHKKVYFPEESEDMLSKFCKNLNAMTPRLSEHALDKLFGFSKVKGAILECIYDWLDPSMIYEFYVTESGAVEKACFRFEKESQDIIIVFTKDKLVATFFLNNGDDDHHSLDVSKYDLKKEA